jgi:hypothetical protein
MVDTADTADTAELVVAVAVATDTAALVLVEEARLFLLLFSSFC